MERWECCVIVEVELFREGSFGRDGWEIVPGSDKAFLEEAKLCSKGLGSKSKIETVLGCLERSSLDIMIKQGLETGQVYLECRN